MHIPRIDTFAGWDFSIWERATIAGVLLIPIGIIAVLVGLIAGKKRTLNIGLVLLVLGLTDLLIFLPNS